MPAYSCKWCGRVFECDRDDLVTYSYNFLRYYCFCSERCKQEWRRNNPNG